MCKCWLIYRSESPANSQESFKTLYLLQRSQPLAPNFSQTNSLHALPLHFFNILFNIILPFTPNLPISLLPLLATSQSRAAFQFSPTCATCSHHLIICHLITLIISGGRSRWPRGLRRGSAEARWLGLRVRISPRALMSVTCECCVLSGRGDATTGRSHI
jgi:hypothetical protein